MDANRCLILGHQTTDFDALGAAVGLTRLVPGSKLVLAGGAHPDVKAFLNLYRNEIAIADRRSIDPSQIRALYVVDTQKRDRLGSIAAWLDLPQLDTVVVLDHHPHAPSDIPATERHVEAVGATTTLVVERAIAAEIELTWVEATAMALGIHADTGSLTFAQTTPRDARALTWLLEQGANLKAIADSLGGGLSVELQGLLSLALDRLQKETARGYTVASVLLETDTFVRGLSGVAAQLLDLTESDALLLAHAYRRNGDPCASIIGRSRIDRTDLNTLLSPLGGGGHPQAASVTLKTSDANALLQQLRDRFCAQIPHPPIARELMSSPVRTIRPQTSIDEAQRILLRYGHSGLTVVDESDRLVGVISRRDIDVALRHGFGRAPVKGYMSRDVKTIAPETLLSEIQATMATYDVGRLPVVRAGELLGIVTRTDVLRELHQHLGSRERERSPLDFVVENSLLQLRDRLVAPLWELLSKAASAAEERGWHLYVVGGAVRDLWLAQGEKSLWLPDIDMVVDGFHQAAQVGAGMELAKVLQQAYSGGRLEVHGEFQTAALSWHKHPELGTLLLDIATARTEFYPYPTANPEVEASSIRQDLYRRDFTVNALALRLTEPKAGELLDFFGGLLDLRSRHLRVLHANSFIEDPTRIYRGVRFAVRLGFEFEPQTESYIRHAIASGVYEVWRNRPGKSPALQTRLKAELKYILQAPFWRSALKLLSDLGALCCLHPNLHLDRASWQRVRRLDLWLKGLDRDRSLPHWQLRLEALIAGLEASDRLEVARNLQLPHDSLKRFEQLDRLRSELETLGDRPSEIAFKLRAYKFPLLLLVGASVEKTTRCKLWHYLSRWQHARSPLDGNDLRQLGYPPGPQYKRILDDLLAATLDGVVSTREEAIALVHQNYSSVT